VLLKCSCNSVISVTEQKNASCQSVALLKSISEYPGCFDGACGYSGG